MLLSADKITIKKEEKFLSFKKAVVVLEDGFLFWGRSTGLDGTATGELCFNTGMTGYQEIFTDPSYFGQIMVATNPHIGNYGIKHDEVESESIKIAGLVCKNFSNYHSRPGSDGSLYGYFKKQSKVVISDIDTRALVRHIQDKGAMNAIISIETKNINILREQLAKVPSMKGLELSSKVTTEKAYFAGNKSAKYKIAVLDLGIKRSILRNFANRNCFIKVFSMNANLPEMLDWEPDGLFISNGPGDPSAMSDIIEKVKAMQNTGLPVFGICLGHQLIALANGLSTYKMHNGHRGINHPVKNLLTGKGEITTQNHEFQVSMEDVEKNENIELTHIHLNNKTVAGFRLKNKPIFCVQYHPEAFPGPHDSDYLFDDFIKLMQNHKKREFVWQ